MSTPADVYQALAEYERAKEHYDMAKGACDRLRRGLVFGIGPSNHMWLLREMGKVIDAFGKYERAVRELDPPARPAGYEQEADHA